MNARKLLTIFLRLDAAVLCLAVLAVFMPTEWMATTHASLGLGEFPDGPLVQYLTRSVSALYFLRGVLTGLSSLDIDRFFPVIVLIGVGDILLGAFLLGLDRMVDLPTLWIIGEGPTVMGVGVVILALCRWHLSQQHERRPGF